MNGLKLDLKDRKILEELDLNARYFISDIAKKVKLNKEVVKYRIHNLEKKGVITGYHTLVNYSKLGLIPIEVSINLMDTRKETVEEMVGSLQSYPSLQSLKLCDVEWDVIFVVVVNNLGDFYNFYDDFKKSFRRFIEMQHIAIVAGSTIYSRGNDSKTEKKRINIDLCAPKEEFDATDIDILKIIAYDAKCPLIDIAKKLKLDSMTIKRRIDLMIRRGIIAGFRTKIEPKAIGINNYSIRMDLFDTTRINSFREYIGSLPETTLIRKAISEYDLEFDIEVKDYFELEGMIDKIKENFPVIREIDRFTTIKTIRPNIHEKLDKIVKLPERRKEPEQASP